MTIVTMETGEKMHPFTRLIALPEPIADLNQVLTVGQALRLTGRYPEQVSIEETKGVGRNRGKVYVRFRVKGVVRKNGLLYPEAWSKKPSLREDTSPVTWQTSTVLPEQSLALLYREHEELRQKHPTLASRADRLYAVLAESLDPRSLESGRAERIWLTICAALLSRETKQPFRPRIYASDVERAAVEIFGISRWTGLADVALPPVSPEYPEPGPPPGEYRQEGLL